MQWFVNWWEGMTVLQQVFACVALPATVLLILQTILLIFGVGSGHDADHGAFDDHSALSDIHSDLSPDAADDMDVAGGVDAPDDLDELDAHDLSHEANGAGHDAAHQAAGLRIFTVRGLIAFFAVGGWLGIAMVDLGRSPLSAIMTALLGGVIALLAAALIIKWSVKMQENGTLAIENAIGKNGSCYLTIPPGRTGTGKVTLTIQEQFVELDAMTDSEASIRSGAPVRVIGVSGENTLIVEPAE